MRSDTAPTSAPDHDTPAPDRNRAPLPPSDLDHLLTLARRIFDVPTAVIGAADGSRVLIGSAPGVGVEIYRGLPEPGASAQHCRITIDGLTPRFCAVVPLQPIEEGVPVALSICDTRPRDFAEADIALLDEIGALASAMLRQHSDALTIAQLARDLDERTGLIHEQASALAYTRKLFDRAAAAAKIGVWECGLDDDTLRWTDGVYDIFELPRGSPISRTHILPLYAPESREQVEALRAKAIRECGSFTFDARIVTALGNHRWMRLSVNVEAEGGVAARIFGIKQDITEEKTLWERTQYLAECDMLTGLANRALFQARLIGSPEPATPRPSALMLLDLDGFKQVNDTFGHATGDECLKATAARLRQLNPAENLVARIGGDEFAILLAPGLSQDAIEALASRILAELGRPIEGSDRAFQLGASIGIALPQAAGAFDHSALMQDADLALYAAKGAGRNTFRTFVPSMRNEADQRLGSVASIAAALAEGRLELFYQPRLALFDGRLSGFETLLQWRRPDGEIVPAEAFGAALEEPLLSGRIGHWVIGGALAQAREWTREGCDFGRIAINLSAAQLLDPGFAADLVGRIAASGLLPGMIEVEVAEAVFQGQAAARARTALRDMRSAGIRVALDNFGTGATSLVQLRTYPIDVIKIDRAFVRHCLTSVHDQAFLEATLGLGARLGIEVVAEGIDAFDQLEALKALGCRFGQGSLFAQAVPAAEAARWHRRAAAPGTEGSATQGSIARRA